MSSPWIVYGQTAVPMNGGVVNPTPNNNGLIGEVHALPYTVPAGKVLVLKAWSIESYATTGAAFIFPWLGTSLTNAACLPTCSANNGTNILSDAEFHIPAGKILNFKLTSGQPADFVFGWHAYGELRDA